MRETNFAPLQQFCPLCCHELVDSQRGRLDLDGKLLPLTAMMGLK
jgi:hypothetical protein